MAAANRKLLATSSPPGLRLYGNAAAEFGRLIALSIWRTMK